MQIKRRLTILVGLGLVALAACSSSAGVAGPVVTTAGVATTSADGSTSVTSIMATTTTGAPIVTEVPLATTTTVAERPMRAGAKRLHFEVGPIDIKPGQNNIAYTPGTIAQPSDNGYVVRLAPNLRFEDGSIPPVDVIHLHHGVWLNVAGRDATTNGSLPERFFAAGEEKTVSTVPDGYGYPYRTSDRWVLNYMIHNLLPQERQVWVTYDVDFIPATDPAAANVVAAYPVWMDVQNGSAYPVFDVLKGSGTNGTYTYPTQAEEPYPAGAPTKNEWTAPRDMVLLGTAGHLHPGGLHTDLWSTRGTKTSHLFTSDAVYYEPAGAVSWDVSMTATPDDWRVAVKAGDTLSTTATYDSERASWYESMGIMVVWAADAVAPGDTAPDPFATAVDRPGALTHGHLAENDHHGGGPDAKYFDSSTIASVAAKTPIPIADFVYGQGDMGLGSPIPAVAAGATITFDNIDAPLGNGIWHTITACRAPCTGETGVAYPLADGDVTFDSGQLGNAGLPTAGTTTWTTPGDLEPGTYTYFCRIHPFMRGSFRITPAG